MSTKLFSTGLIVLGLFLIMFFCAWLGIGQAKLGVSVILLPEEYRFLYGKPVPQALVIALGVATTMCGLAIMFVIVFAVLPFKVLPFVLNKVAQIDWPPQLKRLKFLTRVIRL